MVNTMIEQTILTNYDSMLLHPNQAQEELRLRHLNKRWVVCLTNMVIG